MPRSGSNAPRADPSPADPAQLEALRADWRGFIDPFMHGVFNEPDSEEVIAQMIGIGMDASPDVVAIQETRADWTVPALRLGRVTCPVLIIHGTDDLAVRPPSPRKSWLRCPMRALSSSARAGHRPDIRTPELVDPLLLEFLIGQGAPAVASDS